MNSEPTDLPLTQEQTPTPMPSLSLPILQDFISESVTLWRPQFLYTYSFYLVDNTLFGNVPPVITNPVSHPPLLPRGTVGFN